MFTERPLAAVNELAAYHDPLLALGYESFEEVVYTAQVAGPELAAYLGVRDLDALLGRVSAAVGRIPVDALQIIRQATYSTGAVIDKVPRPVVVPKLNPPALLDPQVNLIADLPPVRDQQKRGTCVAHAALAVYEHYLAAQGADHLFAPQFLYWNCKRSDGISNDEGTWLGVAFPLLQRDGCCLEHTWPYVPDPIPGNEGQGPPPAGAQLQALNFRLARFTELAPTSVSDIRYELAHGRCVAFSIPVFNSWYGNDFVALTGQIGNPIPHEIRNGGHAMCLVGYLDLPDKPALGGGRFIVRNSWGTNWGLQSPFGAGYGTIPYSYLARFCVEAYSIG